METQRMSRISNFISYHILLHNTFLSVHDIAAAMRWHTANLWFLNEGMWRWGEASLSWKNMVALVCKVIFLAFSPYFGHGNKVLLVSWKGLVEMVFILWSSSRTKHNDSNQTSTKRVMFPTIPTTSCVAKIGPFNAINQCCGPKLIHYPNLGCHSQWQNQLL